MEAKRPSRVSKSLRGSIALFALVVALIPLGLSGCYGDTADRGDAASSRAAVETPEINVDDIDEDAVASNFREHLHSDFLDSIEGDGERTSSSSSSQAQSPADEKLAATPEENRWYNARNKIGSYGTVAGPVASVSYEPNVNGSPTFINVGADYPSSDRFQIVIWGDRRAECAEWLSDLRGGRSWIEITGYISAYGNVAQIDLNDADWSVSTYS